VNKKNILLFILMVMFVSVQDISSVISGQERKKVNEEFNKILEKQSGRIGIGAGVGGVAGFSVGAYHGGSLLASYPYLGAYMNLIARPLGAIVGGTIGGFFGLLGGGIILGQGLLSLYHGMRQEFKKSK
jgi:hypothetical protein